MNKNSDLFDKIFQKERPSIVVPFPGYDDVEIALVILTQSETQAAQAGAQKLVDRIFKDSANKAFDAGYKEVYNSASAQEILYRACKDPNDLKKPFFPSKESIGDALSIDQVSILLNHYFMLSDQYGPVISTMNEKELEEYIRLLAEGGQRSANFLNSFSQGALITLLVYMASQLSTSQTDKSLPTSQQENQETQNQSQNQ